MSLLELCIQLLLWGQIVLIKEICFYREPRAGAALHAKFKVHRNYAHRMLVRMRVRVSITKLQN